MRAIPARLRCFGVLLFSIVLTPALADDPKPEPVVPWLPSLAKGRDEAARSRRPILVRVGAEWCPWCRKLDDEMKTPEVRKALERWTLVGLDADRDGAEVGSLGIGPIPALRLLNPTGRVVTSRDGYLPAKELIGWLDENYEKAGVAPISELTEAGAPGGVTVVRLVRQFEQSDPVLREAAIQRLRDYPNAAATTVVDAFARGSLQTRLAALELFEAWRAPITGIDPWQPRTVTEARLTRLRDWAAVASRTAPSKPAPISPEQLAASGDEIDDLLEADPASAAAIRERLARFGKALLPQVYARLRYTEADQARERLTALRYRLVASPALVLKWPGGLDRLAATDVAVRHRAVDELAEFASADDQGLWLELFSDPDPLVRETALRGLDAPEGAGASDALIGLLADPEPNVRAAVLKQLAEHPSPGLAPKIGEYVARETDPDLIVHAVRVLREMNDKKALKVLFPLLHHASWSVRAEAVEAVGKQVESVGNRTDEATVEAFTALIDRLGDPDGFVVGRALMALKGADLAVSVDPLLKVAETHPDLAPKAIEILGAGSKTKPAALPRLGKFATSPRPDVRSAAIRVLGDSNTPEIEPSVLAALSDPEGVVRVAAARAILAKLDQIRMGKLNAATQGMRGGEIVVLEEEVVVAEQPVGVAGVLRQGIRRGLERLRMGANAPGKKDGAEAKKGEGDIEKEETPEEASPYDGWLTRFQEGKEKPRWMEPAVAPLQSMLSAPAPEERLAAALPLIALGRKEAIAVVETLVKEQPDLVGEASAALPWRRGADRSDLFRKLIAVDPAPDELGALAHATSALGDARSTDMLWTLAARETLPSMAAYTILDGLLRAYLGQNRYNLTNVPAATKRRMAKAVRPKAEAGSEWQRVIALTLLAHADLEQTVAVARTIADDPKAAPTLRHNAFQVLLHCNPRPEARTLALGALGVRGLEDQKLALLYLTGDEDRLQSLREWISLPSDPTVQFSTGDSSTTSIPALPKALKTESVRPLLKAADPELAALAGYVLALRGESAGLDPLLEFARSTSWKDSEWNRRAYQAIAELDDDGKVPVLEAIYAVTRSNATSYRSAGQVDIKDFYWTIRVMDGPNARKLRQRIRREVGMETLRGEGATGTSVIQ